MKKLNIPVWRIALILLAVVFISTHISAGLSARYTTKIDAGGTFTTAKFDGGKVSVSGIDGVISEVTKDGYHVFSAKSEVSFGACEVSRKFSLKLTTDDSEATFICPSGNLYTTQNCNGSKVFSADSVGGGFSFGSLEQGYAYVGIANVTGGTAEYEWQRVSTGSDGQVLIAVDGRSVSMAAEKYSVIVLYFKNLTAKSSEYTENTTIKYVLNCEQVD